MRWLLIDCGNSALKWAIASPAAATTGRVPAFEAAGREALDGATGWHDRLRDAWRSVGAGPVAAAFGCSVASADVGALIDAAALAALDVAPSWQRAASRFDDGVAALDNGYREPTQLGADRWHAMIGARVAWPAEPLLVVNAGTATTVDAVTAAGRFDGGVIAPGIGLMRDSLARGTARLPRAAGRVVANPDNTDDAIATGVIEAQAGLVAGRLRRSAVAAGAPVRLLLAGGYAPLLAPHLSARLPPEALSAPISIEDNLVLRGLLWRALAARAEPDR